MSLVIEKIYNPNKTFLTEDEKLIYTLVFDRDDEGKLKKDKDGHYLVRKELHDIQTQERNLTNKLKQLCREGTQEEVEAFYGTHLKRLECDNWIFSLLDRDMSIDFICEKCPISKYTCEKLLKRPLSCELLCKIIKATCIKENRINLIDLECIEDEQLKNDVADMLSSGLDKDETTEKEKQVILQLLVNEKIV